MVQISQNGTSKQVLSDPRVEGKKWVAGDDSLCRDMDLEVRLKSGSSLFFEVHTRGSRGSEDGFLNVSVRWEIMTSKSQKQKSLLIDRFIRA